MERDVILFSIEPSKYSDITVRATIINDISKNINKIAQEETLSAKKVATIKARPAKVGETVDTNPRVEVDGKIYTFSESKMVVSQDMQDAGAIIVTNPDGEEYVITSIEEFNKKYKQNSNGTFAPIDKPKKFRVSNGNYIFIGPWGGEQIVLKDSLFCVENPDKIYSITNSAFNSTYSVTQKELPSQME